MVRTECRPRGLPYLEKLLSHPRGAAAKLGAFVRFRQYVEKRAFRGSRPTAHDRARGNEYRNADPHTVIEARIRVSLPAAAWSVIHSLGNATDSSPKTILEALVLIGLEQTAYSIRATDASPQIVVSTAA